MSRCGGLGCIWYYRRFLILVLTPLLLSIVVITAPDDFQKQARCAFVLLWMAVYWSTEVIPIPVTSLFPIVCMPLLGVMTSKEICPLYFKDITLLFVGGLTVAVAVEHWKLHRRIALKFLLLFGSKPSWMMLGFMLPTWFLSMWISNTATTAMMIPIAQAVIDQLNAPAQDSDSDNTPSDDLENESSLTHNDSVIPLEPQSNNNQYGSVDESLDVKEELAHHKGVNQSVAKGMHLCICYAATIGGIGTLTGTGPNLLLKLEADELFEKYDKPSGITFTSWMMFAIPVSIMCLLISWIYLQLVFIGPRAIFRRENAEAKVRVHQMLKAEYRQLGPVNFAEKMLIGEFCLLAFLWLTRSPEVIPGWSDLLFRPWGDKYITDATPAVFVAITLFFLPARSPFSRDEKSSTPPLLTWKDCATKLPWGVVLLLGGGFAMAGAVKKSGLSIWLAGILQNAIQGIDIVLMILILSILVATLTEFTSNTATATMLIPILATMAESMGIHPLMLMFPAILSCSFAFMLPVATPPNAIVFSYGQVRVVDMMRAGIGMNLICVCVVTMAINTWGKAMFRLHELPWETVLSASVMNITNGTTTQPLYNCIYNSTSGQCDLLGSPSYMYAPR